MRIHHIVLCCVACFLSGCSDGVDKSSHNTTSTSVERAPSFNITALTIAGSIDPGTIVTVNNHADTDVSSVAYRVNVPLNDSSFGIVDDGRYKVTVFAIDAAAHRSTQDMTVGIGLVEGAGR